MANVDHCPHCGEDLTYEYGEATYSRATLVELRGIYDGGAFFAHLQGVTPCGLAWSRWPEGSSMYNRIRPYVEEWNLKYKMEP